MKICTISRLVLQYMVVHNIDWAQRLHRLLAHICLQTIDLGMVVTASIGQPLRTSAKRYAETYCWLQVVNGVLQTLAEANIALLPIHDPCLKKCILPSVCASAHCAVSWVLKQCQEFGH